MTEFLQSYGEYTIIILAAMIIGLVVTDYLAFKMAFSMLIRYLREVRYGKLYPEIEKKINEKLGEKTAMHHYDLHFSDDLFIDNTTLYRKVLADMVHSGKVDEIHFVGNPSIPFYKLSTEK